MADTEAWSRGGRRRRLTQTRGDVSGTATHHVSQVVHPQLVRVQTQRRLLVVSLDHEQVLLPHGPADALLILGQTQQTCSEEAREEARPPSLTLTGRGRGQTGLLDFRTKSVEPVAAGRADRDAVTSHCARPALLIGLVSTLGQKTEVDQPNRCQVHVRTMTWTGRL